MESKLIDIKPVYSNDVAAVPMVDQLAAFVVGTKYEDLSETALYQEKIRILDALACAISALDGDPIKMIQAQITDLGGEGLCTLIGGGRTAPDRAALYHSALVRYLDFNDGYLAKGETCHPSDNLGAVNLFVDHSQIVQLECLRSGLWGNKSLWGRVLTYKG